MLWTKEHDVILCREVLNADIYKTKKNSTQITAIWERIASLNGYPYPVNVDKRTVRDHIGILSYKLKPTCCNLSSNGKCECSVTLVSHFFQT